MSVEEISNIINASKHSARANDSGNGILKDLRHIDIEADRILEKLGLTRDADLRPFVCKVLTLLPLSKVHELTQTAVERATVSIPRYFSTIASKETGKLGRWRRNDA